MKPSLCLIAMTSVDTEAHAYALMQSAEMLRPHRELSDVCLICYDDPPAWYNGRVKKLKIKIDMLSYGRFQVRHLYKAMKTDFMLNIQADGFVTRGDLWDERFLDYDYIGAPWKDENTKGLRVGNSGFSLRSRNFMQLSAIQWDDLKYEDREIYEPYDDQGDDVWWTQINQAWFQSRGIRYAPLDVAARFSVEQKIPEYPDRTPDNTFGQHAKMKHALSA